MEKVNNGTIRIRASEWPSFLYDNSVEYDPNNEEDGLFKGYLLLRVRLFTFSQHQQAYS